jgi:hypothetical protein
VPDSVDFFLYDYCVWGWFTPDGECLHISSGKGTKATRFKDLGIGLSVAVHRVPYVTVRFLCWSETSKDLLTMEDAMVAVHNPRFKKPQQVSRTNHPERPPASNARRERPRCRATIIKNNWRPLTRKDVWGDVVWDGWTCVKADGDLTPLFLSQSIRIQIRKMVTEGYWGEIKVVKTWKKGK